MKNYEQDVFIDKKDFEAKNDLYSETYKTTNINILLNRVRLDQKKTIREKFFFTLLLISLITGLVMFFLI